MASTTTAKARSLNSEFGTNIEKLVPLIKSGSTLDVIKYLKSHNLSSDFLADKFTQVKGEVLVQLLSHHVIDPQVLKDYFVRFPYYVQPRSKRTPCHVLGYYENNWPDIWKPKFIQMYLSDNVRLIGCLDTIISSFRSKRARIYVDTSVGGVKRICHFLWVTEKCPDFILAKVGSSIRRLILTKYL
jgi:hypothetical protein